jgi:hypothetical protein
VNVFSGQQKQEELEAKQTLAVQFRKLLWPGCGGEAETAELESPLCLSMAGASAARGLVDLLLIAGSYK